MCRHSVFPHLPNGVPVCFSGGMGYSTELLSLLLNILLLHPLLRWRCLSTIILFTLSLFFFEAHQLAPAFRSPYLGKATAVARAVLPIPNSVCRYFRVSKGKAASTWDL